MVFLLMAYNKRLPVFCEWSWELSKYHLSSYRSTTYRTESIGTGLSVPSRVILSSFIFRCPATAALIT